MKKAFYHVLIFYSLLSLLGYLAYLFIPYTYIHAPGVHHLILFLMFVVSLLWGVLSLILWMMDKQNQRLKFYAVFNLVPSAVFWIWFLLIVLGYNLS